MSSVTPDALVGCNCAPRRIPNVLGVRLLLVHYRLFLCTVASSGRFPGRFNNGQRDCSEVLEYVMNDIEKIFSCTRCGYCCHGQTTVSLDSDDQERMCRALGMDRAEVADRFWRITDGVVQMKIVDGHCIFYENGCMVHQGRPWRCAEWPLHPSILGDEANFSAIAESCPGIRRELGYQEFCQVLRRILARIGRASC